LSYTRARPFNYHAMEAASTAMHRALETACVPGMFRPGRPLNMPRFAAYTEVSINNERRWSSVLHQALSPRWDRPL